MNDRIAVTIGDPNGIGPEVCAKALKTLQPRERERLIVIGEPGALGRYMPQREGWDLVVVEPEARKKFRFSSGLKSPASGDLSFAFIRKAVELTRTGRAAGIVTGPVAKDLIHGSGHPEFTDHTTYLASVFGVRDFHMLFTCDSMNVLLATIHIPLKAVSRALTRRRVRSAVSAALSFCRTMYGPSGWRIAVCGLNPHAGENGLLGSEEKRIIGPAVAEFRDRGEPVDGPLPADTVFHKAHAGQYRMVVAMYHDQGLAAFKMLHLSEGVNVTWGLPIVRTSPDHGTAFDIAGQDRADPVSMKNAITLALKLAAGISSDR